MAELDTTLGGRQRLFPETTWGVISRLGDPGAGLEDLCRLYWKPIYRYIRVARAKSNEDAKDLAQEFFLWLLDGDALERYSPERGGFRRYIKLLLSRFVSTQDQARHRLKRGGRARFLPLDAVENSVEDSTPMDPAEALDREWKKTLVDLAVGNVRERLKSEGREAQFRVFEEYDLSEAADPPTYADLTSRLGLKEQDVRYFLFTVRQELRNELRTELARTTADETELEEEWRELLGA